MREDKGFVWQDAALWLGNILFAAGVIGLVTSIHRGLRRFVASAAAVVVGPMLAIKFEKGGIGSLPAWKQVLREFVLSPDERLSEEEVMLRTGMNYRVVNDALGYLTISRYISWMDVGDGLFYSLEQRRRARRALGRYAP